tara:strand:- start:1914 stop:2534 length:621 start_codon:yes stop_codon:yes gene_type:complete
LTTTPITTPTTLPVLTPHGVRIPLVGTIACHPTIGFATVVSRTQSTLRIQLDDIEGADDVTLRNGDVITRAAWLSRLSDADLQRACIEISHLQARLNADPVLVECGAGRALEDGDVFVGATAFVKELSASIEASVREADEMIVSIDHAERCGWEFDEFATFTPQKTVKKAKAPKPVVAPRHAENAMPSWMEEEMGECFKDDAVWTS